MKSALAEDISSILAILFAAASAGIFTAALAADEPHERHAKFVIHSDVHADVIEAEANHERPEGERSVLVTRPDGERVLMSLEWVDHSGASAEHAEHPHDGHLHELEVQKPAKPARP